MRDISKRLTVINTEKKDNTSGSNGQSSGVTYVGLGGGGVGNLKDYLLKSIWDSAWELKTDSQGAEYIFCKLPVVTQYGITMYSGENMDIPTIAEGLPFDGKTIWFNPETNQIEVIGGTGGGATTLGSLSNVGSWADSVASQDRIMYQAANSSQWVAKNLSDLAVGGVTGDYLPLSGGTITNSSAVPLTINANNDGQVGLFLQSKGNNKTYVGWDSSRGTCLYEFASDSSLNILNGTPRFNTDTIWHSGNDGSGSGLDADMLDGLHAYISGNNGGIWGYIPSVKSDGVIELGRYIDFHFQSGENIDYATRLYVDAANKNNVALPSSSGTLALLTDNVASATKLQTARTIWGQSFDGTGNVDGDLTTNGGILMRTGTAFDASKYLTLTNNASQYGRIGITFNGSTQDGNDYWGESGRSIISFKRKYGTATSHTHSYAIQHNLVDNTLGILYGSNVGILLNGSGNVGIGTTNPSKKLDIVGDSYQIVRVASTGYTEASIQYQNKDSHMWVSGILGNQYFIWSNTASATRFTLDTSGNGLFYGGVTMYSDARKKTILNHVELSLQQVANAPLIEHYYNSDKNKTTHVGSIAQYWYGLNDWFCKEDNEGFLTMEIQNAALASAISVARELVKFETETDRRIRLLEEENKRLKEEVEQLKWNIA